MMSCTIGRCGMCKRLVLLFRPYQDRVVCIFLRRPGVVFVLQMKYTFIMILLKSNEIIDENFSPRGVKWHAEMI